MALHNARRVSSDLQAPPAAATSTISGGGTGRRWLPSWPPSLPQAVILVAALCLVAGVVGWRLAQDDHPGRGSVDAGFLEDMQTHHLQALEIGYAYLEHGSNPTLRHIARDIISTQGIEVGQMRSVLSDLFTQLMIRHHQGGIHMAEFAATDAETSNIRNFARGMAAGQRSEIGEINAGRRELGLEPVLQGDPASE